MSVMRSPTRKLAGEIEAMLGGGAENHARPRLAARAGHAIFRQRGLGVMGTIVDRIEPRAAAGHDPVEDLLVQFRQSALVDQSPCHGGLVADGGEKHARRLQPPQRGGHAFQQADLLRAEQESLVVDQHAVAIEEHGPAKGRGRHGVASRNID